MNLTGAGIPERIDGRRSTPICSRLWLRRFGADANVLGRKILLDGAPHTVIGVMPPAFRFPQQDVELWTALRFTNEGLAQRDNHYMRVIARLRRGVGLPQARSECR